ncbi:hypothetical protein MHI57_07165 [Cytobacillus sp. FSL K6-0129]|uniref:hypothetical protein n=1 Tax=Cytobacillus sp. FSL K6-0129 TaxID=2921421 RepID=UPI0030F59BB5
MSYDDQIKLLLERIKNDSLTKEPLPGMNDEQYFSLVEDCHQNGYISTSMKQIVFRSKGGGFLADGISLTKKGHDFLNGKENLPTIGQQFNVGTANGSSFGNHGTVTNNYGISFEDLMILIDREIEPPDKATAIEIVETVQEQELNPGLLEKFDDFLKKYPNLASSISGFIMGILTNGNLN